MRALRKGQAGMFALQDGIVGEARIVECACGIGSCAMTSVKAHEPMPKARSTILASPIHQVCNRAIEPFHKVLAIYKC